MSTARAIVSSTIVQLIGKAVTALFSLVLVKILTGYLTTAEYGNYGTIYSVLAMFGIFADMGLYTIALSEMSKEKERIPVLIGNILGMRTVLGIITSIMAIIAAFLIPSYQGTFVPIGVAIASVAVTLALMNGTIIAVLQVYYKMEYSVYATIAGKAVNVLVMAAIIFFLYPKTSSYFPTRGEAFYGLIFAGIVGNLVLIMLSFWYTRKFAEIRMRFDFALWKDVLRRTLPYGIALILSTLYFKVDTFVLSIMKGGADVAIYDVVVKVLEVLNVISLFFLNSLLPVLIKHIQEQSAKLSALLQYSLNFLYALGLPIAVGGYIVAYQLVYLFAQKKYLSGYHDLVYGSDAVLKVLVFAICISFVNSLFGYILVATGKQTKLLWINAGCLLFNVVANLLTIPHWSYMASAYITVASEIFVLIFTFIVARQYLKFHLSLLPLLKITLAALGMGLVVFLIRDPLIAVLQNKAVFLIIIIAGVVYSLLLFVLGIVNKEVIALLRKKAI